MRRSSARTPCSSTGSASSTGSGMTKATPSSPGRGGGARRKRARSSRSGRHENQLLPTAPSPTKSTGTPYSRRTCAKSTSTTLATPSGSTITTDASTSLAISPKRSSKPFAAGSGRRSRPRPNYRG